MDMFTTDKIAQTSLDVAIDYTTNIVLQQLGMVPTPKMLSVSIAYHSLVEVLIPKISTYILKFSSDLPDVLYRFIAKSIGTIETSKMSNIAANIVLISALQMMILGDVDYIQIVQLLVSNYTINATADTNVYKETLAAFE